MECVVGGDVVKCVGCGDDVGGGEGGGVSRGERRRRRTTRGGGGCVLCCRFCGVECEGGSKVGDVFGEVRVCVGEGVM